MGYHCRLRWGGAFPPPQVQHPGLDKTIWPVQPSNCCYRKVGQPFRYPGAIMRYSALAVAAVALLTFSSAATAQQAAVPKLEVGAWTGQVTPPDGGTVNVVYDVTYAGDTLKITIKAAE